MPPTRAEGGPVTEDFAERLAAVWDEVAGRLTAYLRRRGVDHHSAEDAVQEAASEAVCRGVAFSGADDLFAWTSRVAYRKAVGQYRKRSRTDLTPDVGEGPAADDVQDRAGARMALDLLREAVAGLEPADRALLGLSGAVDDPPPGLTAGAEKVRRHRLRKRLLVAVDSVLGLLFWLGRRLKRPAPRAGLAAAGLTLAAAVVPLVLSGPDPSPGPSAGGRSGPGHQLHVDAVLRPSSPAEAPPNRAGPTSSSGRVVPARGGTTASTAPLARVSVPAPSQGQVYVQVRPRRAGEPLYCADYRVTGRRCVDPPPLPSLPPPPLP
ncbi:MAG TPA: sigma-70 family RNA polymerase sigma factor [Acidimicrobiales bacterium]|nr:sigma-70 family RNA polymerase sigma factor [Acidimicrobiales bacterium]